MHGAPDKARRRASGMPAEHVACLLSAPPELFRNALLPLRCLQSCFLLLMHALHACARGCNAQTTGSARTAMLGWGCRAKRIIPYSR